MAIRTITTKQSKRTLLNFLALVLFGWFILLAWAFSLWCCLGFDKALSAMMTLSQKQTQAITELNNLALANKIKTLLGMVPIQRISNQVIQTETLIKGNLHDVFFEKTNDLNHIAEDFIYISKQIWLLICLMTKIMVIKLIILISAIPLFVLATTAGLVDGLNQRAIRTASLGRESSYVFHQLNRYFKRGLFLLQGLWLALPISIAPAFVFVPISLMLSILVSVTASRFKKYL
ncbi:MAG: TIGR03747 family integrating conjugative element membrane protein [Legionella sp.]|nr:TIGR03747 family integrating conjugative element membrane protein [Legionella sp.]